LNDDGSREEVFVSEAESQVGMIDYGTNKKRSIAGLTLQRIAIVLLLLFAASQFIKQVPPENTNGFLWDFTNVCSASRVFLAGNDPFQIDNVTRSWEQQPHSRFFAPENAGWLWVWCAIYPPPSLVMIAPLALMSPAAAHVAWVVGDLTLFVLVCFALWDLGGFKNYDDRLLLLACLLAAAPVVDVFQSGQLGCPACAGVILAVWAVRRDRPILAGVILGLATAVKFQVAGPFIVFYLIIRRWRVGTVALAALAVISLIGIVPLEMHHVPWFTEWTSNAAQSLLPGMGNDPRPGAPFRNDLINVQTWLYGLISSDQIVRTLTIVIFALPASAFLMGLRRSTRAADDLLALSCVALLSFLPVYRRLYDSTVLALLLTWALAALRTPLRRSAIVTLILMTEFLLPIEIVPMMLRRVGTLNRFVNTRLWQTVVVPHHAWAILLLAMWTTGLFYALHVRAAATRPVASDADDEIDLSEAVTG
jgi:hypothetical protein